MQEKLKPRRFLKRLGLQIAWRVCCQLNFLTVLYPSCLRKHMQIDLTPQPQSGNLEVQLMLYFDLCRVQLSRGIQLRLKKPSSNHLLVDHEIWPITVRAWGLYIRHF